MGNTGIGGGGRRKGVIRMECLEAKEVIGKRYGKGRRSDGKREERRQGREE